jgi:hypothetical protein
MKLFEIFGQPVKAGYSKRHTAKEVLLAGIEKQLRLLAGERVENKNGSSIKSWFASGDFVPMVGNRPLLGEKPRIPGATAEKRQQMLIALRDDVATGECDSFLLALEQKRSA